MPARPADRLAFATPVAAWAVTVTARHRSARCSGSWSCRCTCSPARSSPIEQLPVWLRPLAYVTPLWHGVDLCRTLSLGTATLPTTRSTSATWGRSTAAGVAAAGTYRRHIHV